MTRWKPRTWRGQHNYFKSPKCVDCCVHSGKHVIFDHRRVHTALMNNRAWYNLAETLDIYFIKTFLLTLWYWYLRFYHLRCAWYYGWLSASCRTLAPLSSRILCYLRVLILIHATRYSVLSLSHPRRTWCAWCLLFISLVLIFWSRQYMVGRYKLIFLVVTKVTFAWSPVYLEVSLFCAVLYSLESYVYWFEFF